MCGRVIQSSTPIRLAVLEGLDVRDPLRGSEDISCRAYADVASLDTDQQTGERRPFYCRAARRGLPLSSRVRRSSGTDVICLIFEVG